MDGAAPAPAPAAEAGEIRHRSGDPAFRRASIALFCAGLATFALLYVSQPLLPVLSRDFGVSPAMASLSLAVATATLGLALLPAGWLSDAVGRTPVMIGSVTLASLLGLACAAAPSFGVLLGLRALQGVALAGLPAVGMAYLSEEIDHGSLGHSMGLYIGGNAIGGMLGRLIAGGLADVGGWRLALAGVGALGVACAAIFVRCLPPSGNFRRRAFSAAALRRSLRVQLSDPGLLRLDAIGALLMGAFVAIYNGVGFRLAAEPYGLGQAALAAIFLIYPIGSLSSASAGRLADRIGRRAVLPIGLLVFVTGLALTAASSLVLIVLGLAVLTAGFFAGHSVASSWVGRRARGSAAQASALYLLAYYGGSSVFGPLAGSAWSSGGWGEVMALAGVLVAVALVIAVRLRGTPPLAAPLPV